MSFSERDLRDARARLSNLKSELSSASDRKKDNVQAQIRAVEKWITELEGKKGDADKGVPLSETQRAGLKLDMEVLSKVASAVDSVATRFDSYVARRDSEDGQSYVLYNERGAKLESYPSYDEAYPEYKKLRDQGKRVSLKKGNL